MPPESALGFAPADWLLVGVTAALLLAAFAWRPAVRKAFCAFAQKRTACFALLFTLPIVLRLLLLPHHPVPTPDVYDEFSHLLMADTLLHGRLANPPHAFPAFFETFFVLQEPTYSSIYPPGQGLLLAIGRLIFHVPWAGVLLASGVLSAACYWMLLAWIDPEWALLGGLLASAEFGPLCQWTNSYWGGTLAAIGGCLVFGSLLRLAHQQSPRTNSVFLGLGFAIHMLCRPFESLLLLLVIAICLRRLRFRNLLPAFGPVMAAFLLLLFQNHAVTQRWLILPEQLSQYQYGVPAAFTFQQNALPHVPLTEQQAADYRAQSLMHGNGRDSIPAFLLRLEYRVRDYRFFFLPPLYLASFASLFTLQQRRVQLAFLALTVFAIGTNLFPYLLPHYLAAVVCLFVFLSVAGLKKIASLSIGRVEVGGQIVLVLLVLTFGEVGLWYALHLFERPAFYPLLTYETWDGINHGDPHHRIETQQKLDQIPGALLVFVRYSSRHIFQNEWVWNSASIDTARIIYARDLGAQDNRNLIRYYPKRTVLLLEPDEETPLITSYEEIPK